MPSALPSPAQFPKLLEAILAAEPGTVYLFDLVFSRLFGQIHGLVTQILGITQNCSRRAQAEALLQTQIDIMELVWDYMPFLVNVKRRIDSNIWNKFRLGGHLK